jgi:hypothetical protein
VERGVRKLYLGLDVADASDADSGSGCTGNGMLEELGLSDPRLAAKDERRAALMASAQPPEPHLRFFAQPLRDVADASATPRGQGFLPCLSFPSETVFRLGAFLLSTLH